MITNPGTPLQPPFSLTTAVYAPFSLLLFALLPLISISPVVHGNEQPKWQVVRQQDALVLYQRKLGNGQIEVRVQTVVSSSPVAMLALLEDTQNVPVWMDGVSRVELLDKPAPHIWLTHTYLDVPWPFKHRDMVTRSVITQDPQDHSITISVTNASTQAPPTTGMVRMQNVSGQWHILPLPMNNIRVSYEGRGDPGGHIPDFIANARLKDAIWKTFAQLPSAINHERYQQASYPFIQAP